MSNKHSKPKIPNRTESARVASPTVPGAVESLQRSIDTLAAMAKRKQINERELRAGERYRDSHDRIIGQTGGSMDFDRARGGGAQGMPPGDYYLAACEVLSVAKRVLYPKDYAMVHRVCALGFKIEECANLFGGDGRSAREAAGRALRAGLSELADRWFPQQTASRMRTYRPEKPGVTDVETVDPAEVYHATS